MNPLSGSCRHASVSIAELRTHRAVISTLAFLTLACVDGENLFNVADSLVWAFRFAGATAVAQIWNYFVSHDVLQKVKESLQMMT